MKYYRIIYDTRIVGWCSDDTIDLAKGFFGKKKITLREIPKEQALDEFEEMGKQWFEL